MSLLASLFDAAAGGGILGAAGGLVNRWMDFKTEKFKAEQAVKLKDKEQAHEKDRWAHDKAMTELEIQHKTVIAEMDKEKETQLADLNALLKSFEYDKPTYTAPGAAEKFGGWFVFVDVWRGIIRPAATTYFSFVYTGFAAYLTYQLFTRYPQLVTGKWVEDNFGDVTRALTFLTITSVTWWFAARSSSMPRKS